MTGSETECPACRADGLVVYERGERDVLPDLRGIPYCACPHCLARGDFPELVAKASKRGTEETVRELYRIGEVEASSRDIDAYVARKLSQGEVDAHLAKCVEKLRAAPHLCGIRAGLSVATIRQLPPDTGMYVAAEAPRQFALLSSRRYAMVPMVTYRYRFDGETTCIDAQNPKTLQREHRIRITGDIGVYLGDFRVGEVPQVIVGTANPRTAGQIYGAMRAESSLPPPVMGIAGFPLPPKFGSVRILYLLDTPDAPLPLEFAIRSISGPVVYGSERGPAVKVLSPRCPAADITTSDVRMLSNTLTHGKHVREWIAEKLLALGDRREEVSNALLQAGVTDNVRAEIVELLGPNAPESLVSAIMLPMADPDDMFMLGNGRLFKSTPVGLYAVARNNRTGEIKTKSMLCNVGIEVTSRIMSGGNETACCTVTHPDADVPSVPVRLPHAHWNNPEALAEDIRSAYAACGRTPYVTFYRVGGYGWSDIIQFLGSHCPVQSGIRALGATPEGDVNLPNALVSHGRVEDQTKASLLDPDALGAYSAIERGGTATDKDLVRFLASGVSLDRTGVAAGVLHALFCAAGKMFDPSGVRRPPSHLVFVETEPGVWDATLRTLAYLFSGSEYVPLMDYSDRQGFLQNWAALGTLPLITRLPSADNVAAVLSSSPVSVIAVADPLTALACSGRGTFSFVLPHVESADATPISPEDIAVLRASFLSVVAEKAGSGWLDIGCGGPVSLSTPCLSALGSLTDERDPSTVAGGLYRSVKGRYPGVGLTGSRTFFSVLHRAYLAEEHGDNTGIRITMVTGSPSDAVRTSFNERGEHVFIMPDMVVVSRSVVQLINREQAFLFDAEQLSHEFAENGILIDEAPGSLGIDSRRVWVFPRSVWDAEVVRATGFTTRKEAK